MINDSSSIIQLWKSTRLVWIGGIVGLIIGMYFIGPSLFEPTTNAVCIPVNIVRYNLGYRSSRYFTVVSSTSGQSWNVGAVDSGLDPDYRGPAILVASRGLWTGTDHVRVYRTCPK